MNFAGGVGAIRASPLTTMDLSRITPLLEYLSPAQLVAGSAVVLIFAFAMRRLVFSSLAAVPGPWYASISGFYLAVQKLRLRQGRAIDSMFATHGPVVRIANDTIALRDISDAKLVYGFPKNEGMYSAYTIMGNHQGFSTPDLKEHNRRRKALLPHWLPANLALHRQRFFGCIAALVEHLKSANGKEPVDCLVVMKHVMVDVTALSVIDVNVNAMEGLRHGHVHRLSDAASDYPKAMTLRNVLPGVVWRTLAMCSPRWYRFWNAEKIIWDVPAEKFRELRALEANTAHSDDAALETAIKSESHPCLMQRLIDFSPTPLPDETIITECAANFVAGVETSATTTSFGLWELSRRPDVLSRLREELQLHVVDMSSLDVDSLPYLDAFVKEVLRLYAVVPSLLLRTVPSDVDKLSIRGYAIPAGTAIGAQAWSIHRNAAVFPDPDYFEPERWLKDDPAQKV
ncbi:cytochrome P450 [Exidia glandulosa HHB12029]|uniref:Cytochrome P450 n=1 Tax=Exidia glandulosa HHB12029 TaxID=1314781 RepID=A0A165EHQ0_EXIGL|nr:cytochrome P450 [Exidia glandulosa HHB12029]